MKSLDKIFSKNYIVKWACISRGIQTFTKFHRKKHEKSERVFSSFAYLVKSYNFETTTHACVSMTLWRHWRVWEGFLGYPIFKLLLWTLWHVLGDENLEYGILTLWIGCLASCIRAMTAAEIWLLFAVFSGCCVLLFSIFKASIRAPCELLRWLNL